MLRTFGYAVCIYLVIKVSHAMVRPVAGYAAPSPTFRDMLRAGEPNLLLAALTVAVLATVYLDWWFHRLGEREYVHARGCYAQLKAAKLLPRGQTRLDPYEVEEQAGIYLFVAEKHGAWLGWDQDPIRRDFDRATRSYRARHAGDTSPRATAALLGDVRRCFNDEWEPHGEILNP
jgi:hypothetical protein